MNEQILDLLIEIFETKEFTPSTKLGDLETWDSIGMISFIASVDDTFGKIIDADALENCIQVQDLIDLI